MIRTKGEAGTGMYLLSKIKNILKNALHYFSFL